MSAILEVDGASASVEMTASISNLLNTKNTNNSNFNMSSFELLKLLLEKQKEEEKKENKSFYKRKRLWILLFSYIIGIGAGIAGIIMNVRFPEKYLWNIGAHFWLYLLCILLISFLVSGYLSAALIRIWNFSKYYENNIYYYVHSTRPGFHIVLGASFPWIYWEYFVRQSTDPDNESIQEALEWVPRIFLSIIVIGAMSVGKEAVVRLLAGKIQRGKYKDQIRYVLFLEQVLAHLEGNIFKDTRERARVRKLDLDDVFKKSKIQMHRVVQYVAKPKIGSLSVRPDVRSSSEDLMAAAKLLSDKIFDFLDKQRKGYLNCDDFKRAIPDPKFAENSFFVFDKNHNNNVSKDEITEISFGMFEQRRQIAASLKDSHSVEKSLEQLVASAFAVVAIVCILVVFGVDVTSAVIALGSALLAFSFAFQELLTALLQSIVLVFFVRPFDLGDYISLKSAEDDIIQVQSVGLLYTTALDTHSKKRYLYNGTLATECIINHSRTNKSVIDFEIVVGGDIGNSAVDLIKKSITDFCQDNPSTWYSGPWIHVKSVDTTSNKITIAVWCEVKFGWDDKTKRVLAKEQITNFVRDMLTKIGVTQHVAKQEDSGNWQINKLST